MQSSSPSYLLMASLDGARAHAQQAGVWEQPLAAGHAIRKGLRHLPELQLLSAEGPGDLRLFASLSRRRQHTVLHGKQDYSSGQLCVMHSYCAQLCVMHSNCLLLALNLGVSSLLC